MAQAFYCPSCAVAYTAALRGKSCPACGEELIHGRVPAGRRSSMRRPEGSTGKAQWDYIIKKDPCGFCGRMLHPKEITIEHIVPKALGGSKGSWTNRAAACRPCNSRKAHTPLLHFMLQEAGVSIDHLLDENGRWPLPPEDERSREEAVEVDMSDIRNTFTRMRGFEPVDDDE